jgi:hypothetical protein
MAQATITGTFNVDTQNTTANSDTTVGMGDAIVSVSVSEDLGGGLKASANTTIQTNNGRGGAVTNNGYSFGLSGGFGGLSLRNYLVGNAYASAGVSADDDMNDVLGGYFVRTRLEYALPTIVPGLGVKLRWDKTAGDATAATRRVTPEGDTTKIDLTYTIGQGYINYGAMLNDIGGGSAVYLGYNFGVANVDVALTDSDHTEIAVTAPLASNLSAGVHVMMGDVADAYGVRATYALSKRTAVSFNYVNADNTTVKTVFKNGSGDNYRVRVSHSF